MTRDEKSSKPDLSIETAQENLDILWNAASVFTKTKTLEDEDLRIENMKHKNVRVPTLFGIMTLNAFNSIYTHRQALGIDVLYEENELRVINGLTIRISSQADRPTVGLKLKMNGASYDTK